jgi:predicted RNA-binding Zn-ribbon protein involved in translation (DUF1610 family)
MQLVAEARDAPASAPAARVRAVTDGTDGNVRGEALDEALAFQCPRCGTEVTARFYGPCDDCRDQLRASLSGEGRDIGAAEYEPKMNVTPNAVATKD